MADSNETSTTTTSSSGQQVSGTEERCALELRAETINLVAVKRAERRGVSDRLEIGKESASDTATGHEEVNVEGNYRLEGRDIETSASIVKRTFRGRLNLRLYSDTLMLSGAVSETFVGVVTSGAGMCDVLGAAGGLRVTTSGDFRLINGLAGMEEKPGTSINDKLLLEIAATSFQREYGVASYKAAFASYSGEKLLSMEAGTWSMLKASLGFRQQIKGQAKIKSGRTAMRPNPSMAPAADPGLSAAVRFGLLTGTGRGIKRTTSLINIDSMAKTAANAADFPPPPVRSPSVDVFANHRVFLPDEIAPGAGEPIPLPINFAARLESLNQPPPVTTIYPIYTSPPASTLQLPESGNSSYLNQLSVSDQVSESLFTTADNGSNSHRLSSASETELIGYGDDVLGSPPANPPPSIVSDMGGIPPGAGDKPGNLANRDLTLPISADATLALKNFASKTGLTHPTLPSTSILRRNRGQSASLPSIPDGLFLEPSQLKAGSEAEQKNTKIFRRHSSAMQYDARDSISPRPRLMKEETDWASPRISRSENETYKLVNPSTTAPNKNYSVDDLDQFSDSRRSSIVSPDTEISGQQIIQNNDDQKFKLENIANNDSQKTELLNSEDTYEEITSTPIKLEKKEITPELLPPLETPDTKNKLPLNARDPSKLSNTDSYSVTDQARISSDLLHESQGTESSISDIFNTSIETVEQTPHVEIPLKTEATVPVRDELLERSISNQQKTVNDLFDNRESYTAPLGDDPNFPIGSDNYHLVKQIGASESAPSVMKPKSTFPATSQEFMLPENLNLDASNSIPGTPSLQLSATQNGSRPFGNSRISVLRNENSSITENLSSNSIFGPNPTFDANSSAHNLKNEPEVGMPHRNRKTPYISYFLNRLQSWPRKKGQGLDESLRIDSALEGKKLQLTDNTDGNLIDLPMTNKSDSKALITPPAKVKQKVYQEIQPVNSQAANETKVVYKLNPTNSNSQEVFVFDERALGQLYKQLRKKRNHERAIMMPIEPPRTGDSPHVAAILMKEDFLRKLIVGFDSYDEGVAYARKLQSEYEGIINIYINLTHDYDNSSKFGQQLIDYLNSYKPRKTKQQMLDDTARQVTVVEKKHTALQENIETLTKKKIAKTITKREAMQLRRNLTEKYVHDQVIQLHREQKVPPSMGFDQVIDEMIQGSTLSDNVADRLRRIPGNTLGEVRKQEIADTAQLAARPDDVDIEKQIKAAIEEAADTEKQVKAVVEKHADLTKDFNSLKNTPRRDITLETLSLINRIEYEISVHKEVLELYRTSEVPPSKGYQQVIERIIEKYSISGENADNLRRLQKDTLDDVMEPRMPDNAHDLAKQQLKRLEEKRVAEIEEINNRINMLDALESLSKLDQQKQSLVSQKTNILEKILSDPDRPFKQQFKRVYERSVEVKKDIDMLGQKESASTITREETEQLNILYREWRIYNEVSGRYLNEGAEPSKVFGQVVEETIEKHNLSGEAAEYLRRLQEETLGDIVKQEVSEGNNSRSSTPIPDESAAPSDTVDIEKQVEAVRNKYADLEEKINALAENENLDSSITGERIEQLDMFRRELDVYHEVLRLHETQKVPPSKVFGQAIEGTIKKHNLSGEAAEYLRRLQEETLGDIVKQEVSEGNNSRSSTPIPDESAAPSDTADIEKQVEAVRNKYADLEEKINALAENENLDSSITGERIEQLDMFRRELDVYHEVLRLHETQKVPPSKVFGQVVEETIEKHNLSGEAAEYLRRLQEETLGDIVKQEVPEGNKSRSSTPIPDESAAPSDTADIEKQVEAVRNKYADLEEKINALAENENLDSSITGERIEQLDMFRRELDVYHEVLRLHETQKVPPSKVFGQVVEETIEKHNLSGEAAEYLRRLQEETLGDIVKQEVPEGNKSRSSTPIPDESAVPSEEIPKQNIINNKLEENSEVLHLDESEEALPSKVFKQESEETIENHSLLDEDTDHQHLQEVSEGNNSRSSTPIPDESAVPSEEIPKQNIINNKLKENSEVLHLDESEEALPSKVFKQESEETIENHSLLDEDTNHQHLQEVPEGNKSRSSTPIPDESAVPSEEIPKQNIINNKLEENSEVLHLDESEEALPSKVFKQESEETIENHSLLGDDTDHQHLQEVPEGNKSLSRAPSSTELSAPSDTADIEKQVEVVRKKYADLEEEIDALNQKINADSTLEEIEQLKLSYYGFFVYAEVLDLHHYEQALPSEVFGQAVREIIKKYSLSGEAVEDLRRLQEETLGDIVKQEVPEGNKSLSRAPSSTELSAPSAADIEQIDAVKKRYANVEEEINVLTKKIHDETHTYREMTQRDLRSMERDVHQKVLELHRDQKISPSIGFDQTIDEMIQSNEFPEYVVDYLHHIQENTLGDVIKHEITDSAHTSSAAESAAQLNVTIAEQTKQNMLNLVEKEIHKDFINRYPIRQLHADSDTILYPPDYDGLAHQNLTKAIEKPNDIYKDAFDIKKLSLSILKQIDYTDLKKFDQQWKNKLRKIYDQDARYSKRIESQLQSYKKKYLNNAYKKAKAGKAVSLSEIKEWSQFLEQVTHSEDVIASRSQLERLARLDISEIDKQILIAKSKSNILADEITVLKNNIPKEKTFKIKQKNQNMLELIKIEQQVYNDAIVRCQTSGIFPEIEFKKIIEEGKWSDKVVQHLRLSHSKMFHGKYVYEYSKSKILNGAQVPPNLRIAFDPALPKPALSPEINKVLGNVTNDVESYKPRKTYQVKNTKELKDIEGLRKSKKGAVQNLDKVAKNKSSQNTYNSEISTKKKITEVKVNSESKKSVNEVSAIEENINKYPNTLEPAQQKPKQGLYTIQEENIVGTKQQSSQDIHKSKILVKKKITGLKADPGHPLDSATKNNITVVQDKLTELQRKIGEIQQNISDNKSIDSKLIADAREQSEHIQGTITQYSMMHTFMRHVDPVLKTTLRKDIISVADCKIAHQQITKYKNYLKRIINEQVSPVKVPEKNDIIKLQNDVTELRKAIDKVQQDISKREITTTLSNTQARLQSNHILSTIDDNQIRNRFSTEVNQKLQSGSISLEEYKEIQQHIDQFRDNYLGEVINYLEKLPSDTRAAIGEPPTTQPPVQIKKKLDLDIEPHSETIPISRQATNPEEMQNAGDQLDLNVEQLSKQATNPEEMQNAGDQLDLNVEQLSKQATNPEEMQNAGDQQLADVVLTPFKDPSAMPSGAQQVPQTVADKTRQIFLKLIQDTIDTEFKDAKNKNHVTNKIQHEHKIKKDAIEIMKPIDFTDLNKFTDQVEKQIVKFINSSKGADYRKAGADVKKIQNYKKLRTAITSYKKSLLTKAHSKAVLEMLSEASKSTLLDNSKNLLPNPANANASSPISSKNIKNDVVGNIQDNSFLTPKEIKAPDEVSPEVQQGPKTIADRTKQKFLKLIQNEISQESKEGLKQHQKLINDAEIEYEKNTSNQNLFKINHRHDNLKKFNTKIEIKKDALEIVKPINYTNLDQFENLAKKEVKEFLQNNTKYQNTAPTDLTKKEKQLFDQIKLYKNSHLTKAHNTAKLEMPALAKSKPATSPGKLKPTASPGKFKPTASLDKSQPAVPSSTPKAELLSPESPSISPLKENTDPVSQSNPLALGSETDSRAGVNSENKPLLESKSPKANETAEPAVNAPTPPTRQAMQKIKTMLRIKYSMNIK